MTDREKLTNLFNELGIDLTDHSPFGDPEKDSLFLIEGNTDKIDGYCGFYTCFEFDSDGKLIKCGAWE